MSATDVSAPSADLVLVRYGELALKGGNRSEFERALERNIKKAVETISPVRTQRRRGRLVVFPDHRVGRVARRMQDVFGIQSLSPAWFAEKTPEAIAAVARTVLADALSDVPADRRIPFRVSTTRADKTFPMRSTELDRYVADNILGDPRITIDLRRPELTLGIDVRPESAYVFGRRLPGPGGLPVGTLGRAVCLLSGGLDSPVAAYLAMKRGCSVSFVTFHSPPFIGEASRKKVVDVVRRLARYQARNRLFVVPFTEIQVEIRNQAPEAYRTVLYRRFMQRIASIVASRDKARALVTGESIGQVASQTLENMTCIGAAAKQLVLRPLLTFDKEETIALARKIGTFDVSSRQEPDCCTVFMPSNPVIRGHITACEKIEEQLDVYELVQRAVDGMEIVDVKSE